MPCPPNAFVFSGDPVTGTGFLDGLGTDYSSSAGDRRFYLPSGPFTLAPGDMQEVVHAFVAALGADRLSSLMLLRFYVEQLRLWHPGQGLFADRRAFQEPQPELPNYYTLAPNHPNPFAESTRMSDKLPRAVKVRLAIYDLLGHELVVLAEGMQAAGTYHVSWNGRDRHGHEPPSGVYWCHVRAGHVTITRKVALVR
ncbi:MAG: T9SS type A sorting domain-containing protein [candidate division KSB1 bacterium]|nr:T9SS type A sorting domain-containing protein [candidate division KSB1 bacterium]MDZ7274129.1 T9SS type A sorting domain-containing protein [candidate division KSB1 bacterium]MDZ7287826.1 T9SS type A sorting domain-containing protein [candidate division KSB1 bacterium]MDZ7296728.1 T9SS type A sorting domain-containing protein [candidate division KSB1 bacterium]MDZ7307718.1 T9SS type A sorting domain-containing protein [candidate division KSB1 bacterium]